MDHFLSTLGQLAACAALVFGLALLAMAGIGFAIGIQRVWRGFDFEDAWPLSACALVGLAAVAMVFHFVF